LYCYILGHMLTQFDEFTALHRYDVYLNNNQAGLALFTTLFCSQNTVS
jgi:hypothetical protein